jgi:hypothetical protein
MRDGAGIVVDVTDVLVAMEMDHRRSNGAPGSRPARRADLAVYETCGRAADHRRDRSGVLLSLVGAAMSVARLEHAGWIQQSDGWFEAVGSPLR